MSYIHIINFRSKKPFAIYLIRRAPWIRRSAYSPRREILRTADLWVNPVTVRLVSRLRHQVVPLQTGTILDHCIYTTLISLYLENKLDHQPRGKFPVPGRTLAVGSRSLEADSGWGDPSVAARVVTGGPALYKPKTGVVLKNLLKTHGHGPSC